MSRGIDVLTYAAAKAYTDKKVDEGGGGSGPTVVQTTGTSTTDVMSQNATTSMVFADPASRRKVSIGDSANAAGIDCICIGPSSNVLTGGTGAVSIGDHASASGVASIALGYHANATERGQMDISTGTYSSGYNSTKYRLLTGVHDPVNAHDAATKGYVDSHSGGVTPVQSTGTSTTDVMSQNAVTSMVYRDPSTAERVQIGGSSSAYRTVAIGKSSSATSARGVAIGEGAQANGLNTVAIGGGSSAPVQGEMNIGTPLLTGTGYNNTDYRLLTGVHDGQNAHDAATVGQINATIDAINTALSTNIPHIGA